MQCKNIIFGALIFTIVSCNFESEMKENIQVQGHRGDRGNFPENSIPAFLSAVEKGVDVLELDVVISKDKKVVVSHEPFMASEYMLMPNGNRISKNEEKSFNFYHMSYDSIRKFDAGSGENKRFVNQKKIKTYKPLLSEVFERVENYIVAQELDPVSYNIEIKSGFGNYEIFQPLPEEFVELLMKVVQNHDMEDKIVVQSFDPTPLTILRKKYPAIPLAFLVEKGTPEENLQKLNFQPEIYSPYFRLLTDRESVCEIQKKGMQVIPWTVNSKKEINRMIGFEVDGIISDYPERVISLLKQSKRIQEL
ncbi:glycerophosphodiester phosphodiesterase family protein [Salinimicrobium sp. GXAS 041]|uniref:glycerophosphodiester phosphodiesterase family protein n=1 Tax=Salinimicrobium sp. GXAS 041 TaxID=3400806 RepID=UPI003C714016